MNKRGFIKKILLFIFFMVILMVMVKRFETEILSWLETYPLLWAIFSHMREQVEQKSLLGLWYLTFGANLFFVFFPIEVAVAYYFTLDYPFVLVLAAVLAGTIVGQFFNYLVGLLLGRHVFGLFFKSNMDRMESHSERWGFWMLLLFSIIPFLPLDVISIFLGSMRYKLRKFLIWICLMNGIKYILVFLFADWVQNSQAAIVDAMPYLSNFI